MKKLLFLIYLGFLFFGANAQIIADHTVVDRYDEIPQEYLDEVKKLLVSIGGESHSSGYRIGMDLLEEMDGTFQVETFGDTPVPPVSDQYLRIGRHRVLGEDYVFSESRIASLKNEITAQYESGDPFNVMGFAWCWDMTDDNSPGGLEDPVYNVRWAGRSEGGPDGNMRWGLDSDDQALTGNSVCMDTYLEAIESYILYCKENSYPTTWVFTTGPVDYHGGTENGFQREIKHNYIRSYVLEDQSRVLFDYADILCRNNSGEHYLEDWNDDGTLRSHAQIHPDNMMDYDASWNLVSHSEDGDHIGEVGAVRLAKAMWWMLARMAGWEEEVSSIEPDGKRNEDIFLINGANHIIVNSSDHYSDGTIKMYNLSGILVHSSRIVGSTAEINTSSLSPGQYIVTVSKDNVSKAVQVFIAE